jgi:division/cell wall cluster transcriptional repressor MraZ
VGKPVKIDNKGRLKIPANLVNGLKELGTEFFIASEDGQSARIYPLRVWAEIEKQLVKLSAHDKNMEKLLVRAKYFGQTVNMDVHGRVLIPSLLRKTALIRGEVDVLDYPNYLEVWNHTRFVKNLNRSPITEQDELLLDRLAH